MVQHFSAVPVADHLLLVPEVAYVRVGHSIAIPAVAGVAEEHVEPHCVHAQIRIAILAEDVLLDPTGPFSALGSSGRFPVTFGCLTGWVNAWTDSDVQGRPVDELLDVAVERPALDQLEVEVGRTLEDRVQPGLTGDHGEERHLDAVDQSGGH
jgi:hypothetical protein